MTDPHDDTGNGIPVLTERHLVPFSARDAGWVSQRPQLPETALDELNTLLTDRLPADKLGAALGILCIGFSDAVEASLVKRRTAVEADASPEAKKPSSKSGVRLRACIDEHLVELNKGGRTPEDICSSIAADRELAKLVTLHLEERMRPIIVDPLRRAPQTSAEYLTTVLNELRTAIDSGVTTGTVAAAHDMIAKTVFSALLRTTGKAPKRNWDNDAGDDSGYGLECCRILARELHLLTPVKLRRLKPVDMAKAWRRAIEEDATAT